MVLASDPASLNRDELAHAMRELYIALWDNDEVVSMKTAKDWFKNDPEYSSYFAAYLVTFKDLGVTQYELHDKVTGQIVAIKKRIKKARNDEELQDAIQRKHKYNTDLFSGLRYGVGTGKWS